jgi:hypothetical protein
MAVMARQVGLHEQIRNQLRLVLRYAQGLEDRGGCSPDPICDNNRQSITLAFDYLNIFFLRFWSASASSVDFNPEQPVTLEESRGFRAACYRCVRNNLGIVGTEGAADWVIPYVDLGSANPGQGRAIPVPLYELVYHDAIVLPMTSVPQKLNS